MLDSADGVLRSRGNYKACLFVRGATAVWIWHSGGQLGLGVSLCKQLSWQVASTALLSAWGCRRAARACLYVEGVCPEGGAVPGDGSGEVVLRIMHAAAGGQGSPAGGDLSTECCS